MTPYQTTVRDWHAAKNLATGFTGAAFTPQLSALLRQRADFVEEEGATEMAVALNAGDIVGVVDSLTDALWVSLGTFDVVGAPAHGRFVELIETSIWRPFQRWTFANQQACNDVRRQASEVAADKRWHSAMGREWSAWEQLDALNKTIAHAFGALGVDPRPCWAEVARSNWTKRPALTTPDPITGIAAKLGKGPDYVAPDIAGVLREMGVSV